MVDQQEVYKNPPKNWETSNYIYAYFIEEVENKEEREKWFQFAGWCIIAGMTLDFKAEDIMGYVLEAFHSLSLDEINDSYETLKEDLKTYIIET